MKNNDKPLVLAVDDNLNNLRILGNILRENGYNPGLAENGMEVFNFLKERNPDIILLDIMMPQLDGFKICQKIKEDPNLKDIPIIFLTAKANAEDIVKGFEIGAVDYVTKPFNGIELLARLDTHLKLKKQETLLRKSVEEKNELLHVLCHDLLNPIGATHNILENMVRDFSDFKKYQADMTGSLRNAMELIHLVKQMRMLEAKREVLKLETVHLKRAFFESYYILRRKFIEKSIELVVNIEEDAKVIAENTSLVNSVFNNLLTNSIKFSHPNSKIVVTTKPRKKSLEVIIQDSGIGMSPVLLESIFDVSRSTSRLGTNGENGTGFGMPLIKKFMNFYGGDIKIKSKEKSNKKTQHGTIVTLSFKTKSQD